MHRALAPVLLAASVWAACAVACAQGVDVTASLELTDGLARPGAYVPVMLRTTNRTQEAIARVRVTTGGPMGFEGPWPLAPGESTSGAVPVFYAGAPPTLEIEFLASNGATLARATPSPPPVRPVPDDTALVGLQASLPGLETAWPDPDAGQREAICTALGKRSLRVLRQDAEELLQMARLGLLDAVVTEEGRAANFASLPVLQLGPGYDAGREAAPALPAGIRETVQPRTHQLLATPLWPMSDRRRLWLGLGWFALAVLVAGALALRRRIGVAVVTLVLLSAAAVAALWLLGDVRWSRVREARVFFVRAGRAQAALEHLVLIESRGGATALVPVTGATWPLPVLASSEDLFRQQATLRLEHGRRAGPGDVSLRSARPRVMFHTFSTEEPGFGVAVPDVTRAALQGLAGRPDVARALRVEGNGGTDAAGRAQTLDAWAVAWRGSDEPDVAYAGRSLAWWDRDRREGDGPFLLAWFHDPLPEGRALGSAHQRLAALVIFTGEPMPN